MNTWVIACFIVFSEGCRANQEDGVVASTKFGNVIGFTEKTEDGFEADVFLGIPYAQPPIGENRFEKPKPVNPWKPETIVAKKLAPSCIPTSKFFLKQLANYSEDCLFLNIMTPKKRSSELLPVFVFIHGGAFVIGTPEIYGYDKPVDNFVRHEIVYVTLAYRLGPFGFFSTGDDTMPGNLGLWDQSQALRFLHEILPDFGGDPNRITLSGHSAGSASVSAHLFSPHSNQLFERASQFSGSLFAEWAINENVVENSKNLAKELKCEMSSSKSIHECIKSKPLDAILEILDKQPPFLKSPRLTAFSPRFDRDFFPNQFDELIRKAPKKATLNFVTNLESGGAVKKEMWKTYKKEDLISYIRDYVSVEHELGRRSSPLLIELLDYYVNRDEKEEPSYYMTRQCELLSDLQFNVPILHEVELKQEHGWDTYLVVMDYESEPMRDKESPIRGVYHVAEHRFLFKFLGMESVPFDENDKKFKHHILSGIVNFIKKGEPKSESIQWPKVSKEHPMRHLRIRPEPIISDEFRKEEFYFWTKIAPDVVGAELLRKTRLPLVETSQSHSEL